MFILVVDDVTTLIEIFEFFCVLIILPLLIVILWYLLVLGVGRVVLIFKSKEWIQPIY